MSRTLFRKGLSEQAAGRTTKYVIERADFKQWTGDMYRTYEKVKELGRNDAKIMVDGEAYQVTEYAFPTNMVRCLQACRVSINSTSVDREGYYHTFKSDDCATEQVEYYDAKENKTKKETLTFKLLSPTTVAKYFALYNKNQEKDDSGVPVKLIELAKVNFVDTDLLQFKHLLSEDGKGFVDWNEGGQFDEYVAYFNDVKVNFGDTVNKLFDVNKLPNEEKLARWLIS